MPQTIDGLTIGDRVDHATRGLGTVTAMRGLRLVVSWDDGTETTEETDTLFLVNS